jgi:hypothetical protein
MSKQDTAGRREYVTCNDASETWNNWEAWKWQKLNGSCGFTNFGSSAVCNIKKQKDQMIFYDIKWQWEWPFQAPDIEGALISAIGQGVNVSGLQQYVPK